MRKAFFPLETLGPRRAAWGERRKGRSPQGSEVRRRNRERNPSEQGAPPLATKEVMRTKPGEKGKSGYKLRSMTIPVLQGVLFL